MRQASLAACRWCCRQIGSDCRSQGKRKGRARGGRLQVPPSVPDLKPISANGEGGGRSGALIAVSGTLALATSSRLN